MDGPSSDGLLIPVLQGGRIFTWFGEGEGSVGFGCYVDRSGGFGILSEEVFKVLERPGLELGILGEFEERGDIRRITLGVGDGKGKVGIGHPTVVGFGTVDGRVDFESDVELGSGEELGLIRRKDTSESRTSTCRRKGGSWWVVNAMLRLYT
jgi:hypothetical protein